MMIPQKESLAKIFAAQVFLGCVCNVSQISNNKQILVFKMFLF